jgi:hypothetical protein
MAVNVTGAPLDRSHVMRLGGTRCTCASAHAFARVRLCPRAYMLRTGGGDASSTCVLAQHAVGHAATPRSEQPLMYALSASARSGAATALGLEKRLSQQPANGTCSGAHVQSSHCGSRSHAVLQLSAATMSVSTATSHALKKTPVVARPHGIAAPLKNCTWQPVRPDATSR